MSEQNTPTQVNTDVGVENTPKDEKKDIGSVVFQNNDETQENHEVETEVAEEQNQENESQEPNDGVDENTVSVEDLGLPEELSKEISDFGFDIPQGVSALNEFAKENKLTKEQRSELSKFYIEKFVKPQIELANKKLDEDYKSLVGTFGSEDELRKAQPITHKGMVAFFGDDHKKAVELLATAGLSLNPVFYNAIHRYGLENSEDKTAPKNEFTKTQPQKTLGNVIFGEPK